MLKKRIRREERDFDQMRAEVKENSIRRAEHSTRTRRELKEKRIGREEHAKRRAFEEYFEEKTIRRQHCIKRRVLEEKSVQREVI